MRDGTCGGTCGGRAAVDIPVVTTMVSGYGEAVDCWSGAGVGRRRRGRCARNWRRTSGASTGYDAARTSIALGRLHLAMGEVGPAARCFDRAGELASMCGRPPNPAAMAAIESDPVAPTAAALTTAALRQLRGASLRQLRAFDRRGAAMVGRGRVGRWRSRTKRTIAAKRARGDRTGSRSASGVRHRVVARALPVLAGPRPRNRSSVIACSSMRCRDRARAVPAVRRSRP